MAIDRSRRNFFEQVADLYDRAAFTYPEELIEEILELSKLPVQGRILEIGCGPGNATRAFGERGCRVLGIELGERLAAHARRNCRAHPGVRILNTSFEDWPLEPEAFDLVTAFDALHWIPPEIAYPKIARALKAGGSMALVFRVPAAQDPAWEQAVAAVYAERGGLIPNPDTRFSVPWLKEIVGEAIRLSGGFGEITVREHGWREVQTAGEYLDGLRTYSAHQEVAETERERLYTALRGLIERRGGRVEQQRAALLFFTNRKP